MKSSLEWEYSSSISFKVLENLAWLVKLAQSVIQKGLPVILLPMLTMALRTATSIFSISLNMSKRSFLSKSVEHHHFPEGCLGLELVLRLQRIQKRIHVRRKAIIANVLQIVFSLLVIMDG